MVFLGPFNSPQWPHSDAETGLLIPKLERTREKFSASENNRPSFSERAVENAKRQLPFHKVVLAIK